jgi:elongation factor 1-gamma
MFRQPIYFFNLFHTFFLSGGNADQTAVASLVPNSGILGISPEEPALIDQWMHLAETEVEAFSQFVRGLCSGRFAYSKLVCHSSFSSK